MILFAWIFVHLAASVFGDDPIVSIIETNPPVNPLERKIISEKDKDVQMTCVVENRPKGKEVQWVGIVARNSSVNTIPISTGTRSYDPFKYSIDVPSPTSWRLRIQNAQVTDEGVYSCQVQIASQNYAKAEEDLVIVEKPYITDLETSSDVSKSEGESLTLKCYASGRPPPVVKWTRMAGELLPSGGREHLQSDLIIPVLQARDAGIYKCSASNSAGTAFRDIRISISYAPQLQSPNPVVQQAVGYVKELVCDVRGSPTPSAGDIVWSKRGTPLQLDSRVYVRTIPGATNRMTSILVFWGVREDDYGEYTCSAKNIRGSASIDLYLQMSSTPSEDRSNRIRAGASVLAATYSYIILSLSVCLLYSLIFH